MGASDINALGFLKGRMKWHQARQHVLANNVANADTPFYKPHDLKEVSYKEALKANEMRQFQTTRTHRKHFASMVISGNGVYATKSHLGFEVRPAGNAVVLEEQMMKVTQNQFDFRMASTLYSKSLGLLKTAIGRNR